MSEATDPVEIVRTWFAERQYGKRIQRHTAQELLDRLGYPPPTTATERRTR